MTNITMLSFVDRKNGHDELRVSNGTVNALYEPESLKVTKDSIDDKTSDNYIPKSYRSQARLGVLLTQWMEKYLGVLYLQPIKWTNAILIFMLHIVAVYYLLTFNPVDVCWQTYFWGKFGFLILFENVVVKIFGEASRPDRSLNNSYLTQI